MKEVLDQVPKATEVKATMANLDRLPSTMGTVKPESLKNSYTLMVSSNAATAKPDSFSISRNLMETLSI
mgnify:CR=1 FL=1